jgi:hypothetical protein
MIGKKAFVVLAATIAATPLGPAFANDGIDTRDHQGGNIVPCSLAGVNPAYHPEIFGNPAVAATYGFIQASDGSWHVEPNCRR